MKNLFKFTVVGALALITLSSCSEDSPNNGDGNVETPVALSKEDKQAVINNYAKIVHANYSNSLKSAKALQVAINAFVENPTEQTLQLAKKAWLDAREDYGVSEAYRGSNGPIDREGGESWVIGNEGQINAWPLNEAYIDYVKVKTDYTGGDESDNSGIYDESIIEGEKVITKELLVSKNEGGVGKDGKPRDEAAVSTGWHAIEFLLWGQDEKKPSKFTDQDLSKNTSGGNRPVSDYTGEADNKRTSERRKKYLTVVTDLLVEDLQLLVDTWAEGGEYNKVFKGLTLNEALQNIIEGPQFLAAAELSNERMLIPAYGSGGFDESGQEDEHSCFSDNTHRDIYLNAKGIVNVLKGEYADIKGKSILDLVKKADKKQGEKLESKINEMWVAIKAIDDKAKEGTPFDLMILQEGKQNPTGPVLTAEAKLKELGDVIRESAAKIKITTTVKYDLTEKE